MNPNSQPKSFAEAGRRKSSSLAGELLAMVRANRKWWLIPILVVLAVFGGLLILGSTGAAPFIYALF